MELDNYYVTYVTVFVTLIAGSTPAFGALGAEIDAIKAKPEGGGLEKAEVFIVGPIILPK